MARFYGTVQGARGEASRLGHHSLTTVAASWKGAVKTELYLDDDDRECAAVRFVPWRGKGPSRVIFDGPIA